MSNRLTTHMIDATIWFGSTNVNDRGRKRHVCVAVPKECVKLIYRTEGVYCRYIQCIRISVFVSLGVYICLLLIVYLKISLIYIVYFLYI